QFKMVCERPPRSLRSRLPLMRGRLTPATWELYSPPREGESRRRRQGVAHTPSGIGLANTPLQLPLFTAHLHSTNGRDFADTSHELALHRVIPQRSGGSCLNPLQ